ncbi:MAG: AsmA family protein [Desulfuromonas sp.]|nr:AsmA family protein [Desulfuromonas sp.]
MGSKVLKYFSLFALGSLIVVAALLIAAHFLVTPERVRDAVVPVMEQQLQRKVKLASVDVSLFSGVTLTQLEILDHDNRSMLIAAEKVVLRYQFWPLLLQRVVIDEIRLEHPRLNIERSKDGHFNFSDLFDDKQNPAVKASTVTSASGADNGIDLLISKLYVNRGELLFKDHSFGGAPHRYKLTDFDLKISQLSFDRQSSLTLWGKLNGSPVDIEGTFALGQKKVDLDIIVDNLNLIPFQPYYRQQIDGRLDDLTLGVDLNVAGSVGASIRAKGEVLLKDLDLSLNRLPKFPVRSQQISVALNAVFDAAAKRLSLENFALDYDGIPVQIVGEVSQLDRQPQLDLTVTAERWPLRTVIDHLPSSISREVSGFDPAGDVALHCSLRGRSDDGKNLVKQARITLDAVQLTIGGVRPRLEGIVTLQGAKLSSEALRLVLGDNILQLTLSSDDWRALRPVMQLSMDSGLIDFDHISSASVSRTVESSMSVVTSAGKNVYREINEPGPINLPLTITGSVEIGQLLYQQMQVDGVRANYQLRNNVLSYQDIVGRIANGSFRLNGHVDLRQQGLTYKGQLSGQGLQLELLVPQLKPEYQGVLSGTASVDGEFKGAGTQSIRVQQNLSATGSFIVDNGQMTGTGMLGSLAQFIQVPELRVFRFQQGKGIVQLLTGGQLNFDGQFVGSRARLYPRGVLTLGGEIESTLDLHLAPAVVAELDPKSKISSYLSDEEGWGKVPLIISGRYDKPAFAFDVAALGKTATRKATSKLQKKLEEKLGPEAGTILSEPGAELIDSALKGIFGN